MTTKTKEEVIKALNCCARGSDCDGCPYFNIANCNELSKYDAIYYLYKDSDDEKRMREAIGAEEERRLRQVVRSQQQTINALLNI